MTSIFKGLVALIAVLTVSVGGTHLGSVHKPVHHTVTASKTTAAATTDPVGTDAYLMRGRTQVTVIPPTPPPDEAPIAAAPAPRHVAPPVAVGSTQQALINQDRTGDGLGSLSWSSCLAGIAYQNALRMANAGAITHAGGPGQDLGCGLGRQAGENVGYWSGGVNDPLLNTMFMNSTGHRANILGPYRYVGTAWVVAGNGYAYIAVEFS